ncbi:hypothetical protein SHIRM173S_02211 [Streptomyces hirsutus]
MTFQYSVFLSPLPVAPVRCSTRLPSSFFAFHEPPDASDRAAVSQAALSLQVLTSSTALPLRTRVALAYFQHRSPLPDWPSSLQEAYLRSM